MKKVLKIFGIVLGYALYTALSFVVINYVYICSAEGGTKKDFNQLVDNIIVKDDITITHKEANNYLTFKGLKIKNVFANFKKVEQDSLVEYRLEDTANKRLVTFAIGINDDLINASWDSETVKKYNIKNDIDYIKVLKNYEFKETKIDYNKAEENSGILSGAYSYSDENSYYNFITGDYSGMMKTNTTSLNKTVWLYGDNNTYELEFNSFGYFTDEQIMDLISTVIID